MFIEGLSGILEVGEKMIADGGYKGQEQINTKGHCREDSFMGAAVRARHEIVNSCLKIVKCCQRFLGMIYDFTLDASIRLQT